MSNFYIVTEALFHTSFLVNSAVENLEKSGKYDKFIFIIRNKNGLSKRDLDHAHKRSNFSCKSSQIEAINKAYKGVSSAERELLKLYDIPQLHCLSGNHIIESQDLNSDNLRVKLEKDTSDKRAGIFLDCILSPWWIDIFSGRVVNAHTAILPFAKGMHAIEQYILESSIEGVENTAGATIHYIDSGVDTGNIIKTKKLNRVWSHSSISHIKAESYLLAFKLLIEYALEDNSFCINDAYKQDNIGKEFYSKHYSQETAIRSNERFLKLKHNELEISNE
ncbi:formyltransferase family protein [Microbulbifer sp. JMSA004]|uniref:formyltransferase family protein n=1 Tax=unclassified Microbulbifer TaxID=2619833 RepID=UPI0024AD7A8E|nr:formyltransferase family protein [Microbulbifer sp. VAAF005]WHI45916.1 formyltransferase family protein [Microbulbifer sp. VAAF005]